MQRSADGVQSFKWGNGMMLSSELSPDPEDPHHPMQAVLDKDS